jgi:hypothetical protein
MIRFILRSNAPPSAQSALDHPALSRLAEDGPWRVQDGIGIVMLTHATAPAGCEWGPEQTGLGGLVFQLPAKLSPLPIADLIRKGATDCQTVRLVCGLTVPIAPAMAGGSVIGLNGEAEGIASEYGLAVEAVSAAFEQAADAAKASGDQSGGAVRFSDPCWLPMARLALRSALRLPAEAIHGYRILASGDYVALWEAALALPKIDAAGSGSPAGVPESTPTG